MNHENNVATASGKTDNMPKDYIYCPAADGACPRAPQCLRAIAYRQLTATEASDKPGPIRIVHPACVAHAQKGCDYYRDSTPVRFAQGMTKLFDEIPHRLEADIRRRIMAEGRTTHHAQGATGHSQRLPPGRTESRTGVR